MSRWFQEQLPVIEEQIKILQAWLKDEYCIEWKSKHQDNSEPNKDWKPFHFPQFDFINCWYRIKPVDGFKIPICPNCGYDQVLTSTEHMSIWHCAYKNCPLVTYLQVHRRMPSLNA